MKIILQALTITLISLLTIVNPTHAARARLQAVRSLTHFYPTNLGSLTRFCPQATNALRPSSTKLFSSAIPKLPASTKEYAQQLKNEGEKALTYAFLSIEKKNDDLAHQKKSAIGANQQFQNYNS